MQVCLPPRPRNALMGSVFILAVENSADHLGAGLIKGLRELDPEIEITGIGGAAMAGLGVSGSIDLSQLAVLGFVEALSVYAIVLERVKQVRDFIMSSQPDSVVLIDSWGFMIRVAKALKKAGYKGKIIKYVAPQVWAMREGRAKILAHHVDCLLSLHSFDAPYFEKYGLPTHYVGNPVFEDDYAQGDAARLRKEFNIKPDTKIIAVLFGSRLSEIQTLSKPFADAVDRIKPSYPDMCFISPLSETISTDVKAAAGKDPRLQDIIFLPENRKWDVFAAAHTALSCSGTVTSQLAYMGVPSVVGYRLNPLTYIIAKRLYKPNHISIVNIAANRAIMPEFMQSDCNGENLSGAILKYLNDSGEHEKARKALRAQTELMKGQGGPSYKRAAKAVLSFINGHEIPKGAA